MTQISGFSKLSKAEKINWLTMHYFANPQKATEVLELYWNSDQKLQRLHDEFSENTISNYYLPFGIAPNFLINDKMYAIPMAVEESSVVAAASKAAKFWLKRGGFKTEVISTIKSGQVHLSFDGATTDIKQLFVDIKPLLLASVKPITQNMEKRGGGLTDLRFVDKTAEMPGYYQLDADFETVDAMGANFINSCLEQLGKTFKAESEKHEAFSEHSVEIVMAILSNYVPECLVRAEVSCELSDLSTDINQARKFAEKFVRAVQIAQIEPRRAVTHNKGIMNGIDAVVLATGNDFRAVEACAHAYAAKEGQYRSLTYATLRGDQFKFWIEIPLALGTVGGLTSLHPLVKLALELLQNPTAKKLMQITAVAGLAQNFGAIQSLVTTGIQEGHMKMHLLNILNQFDATKTERKAVVNFFKDHTVSHSAVKLKLEELRAQ